jgi:FAD/FMN-containing dehydrogenase
VLRLFPQLRRRSTAWIGLPSLDAAVRLLRAARDMAGDRLVCFEAMSDESLRMVLASQAGTRDPLGAPHAWYGLVELADSDPDVDLDALMEKILARAVEEDIAEDAVVAGSPGQRQALWDVREGISEAQNHAGPSLKHDVSVPISSLADFVRRADEALQQALPGVRIVSYGHVGDGNVHYNLSKPVGGDDNDFLSAAPELTRVVYDIVATFGGSISAEHGLGVAKRVAAAAYKPPVELDLMRAIKVALDPAGLMNPGKVLPDG